MEGSVWVQGVFWSGPIDSSLRDTSMAWFHGRHEPGTSANTSWSATGDRAVLRSSTLHEIFRVVPDSCWLWYHAQSTYLVESCRLSMFWWSRSFWNHPQDPWPQHPLPYAWPSLGHLLVTHEAREFESILQCSRNLSNMKPCSIDVSRRDLSIGGVFWHQKVYVHVQITQHLKFSGPKKSKNVVTQVIFNNFPETFDTSNLAHSTQLAELPIHCRCLFGQKMPVTQPNLRITAQLPTLAVKCFEQKKKIPNAFLVLKITKTISTVKIPVSILAKSDLPHFTPCPESWRCVGTFPTSLGPKK